MATLNQQPLPVGWESRLDPRTGRSYYINHNEHITTWEDPRLIPKYAQPQSENIALQGTYAGYYLYGIGRPPGTPNKGYPSKLHNSPVSRSSAVRQGGYSFYGSPRLIHQGFYPHTAFNGSPRPLYKGGVIPFYGSPRTSPKVAPKDFGVAVNVDEKMANKMCMQFPTVDEGYVRKMLKKYKNRENVVVSALMSEGHPRAATHNTPELPTKATAKGFVQVDVKLAMKLRSIFPTVDEDWLFNLLARHNNNEEEVVANLVSAGYPFTQSPFQNSRGSRNSSGQSSPKMKLRYLKGVFPTADEAVLFDVLINCDNQTQDSISRLTSMGYEKQDSPLPKPSKGATAKEAKPSPPPQTFSVVIDKVKVKRILKEEFSDVSEMVVNMALESTQFDETKARQLLKAMTPQDSRPTISFESPKVAEDLNLSTLKRSRPPSTGDSSASSVASQPSSFDKKPVTSSRLSLISKLSSESKIEGSPKPPPRTKGVSDVKRLSYDFQEAKEVKTSTSAYLTQARGPDTSLRHGPDPSLLRSSQNSAEGPKLDNRKGTNSELHKGPDKSHRQFSGSRLAKGPQRSLRQGPQSKVTDSSISHLQSTLVNPANTLVTAI